MRVVDFYTTDGTVWRGLLEIGAFEHIRHHLPGALITIPKGQKEGGEKEEKEKREKNPQGVHRAAALCHVAAPRDRARLASGCGAPRPPRLHRRAGARLSLYKLQGRTI